MSATEDLAPVITVDWEAVESDVGTALVIEDSRREQGGGR
jgi:hypothetical protein